MTTLAPLAVDRPAGAIDVRGPRVAATFTTVVLAAALLAPSTVAIALLIWQGLNFAAGAAGRPTAYSWLFATVVRPRLRPATEWEDPAPPRFAQAVGLAFVVGALLAFALGAPTVALVLVGFALAAAVLNAGFGFCLGCEMYLIGKRLLTR